MCNYKWSQKSPSIGYNYSCPTYNSTYNYPYTLNPKPYRFLKGTQRTLLITTP